MAWPGTGAVMSRTIATVRRPGPHPYTANQDQPADHNGRRPCTCGLPEANSVHAPADLPDLAEATAEHRRRIGETE